MTPEELSALPVGSVVKLDGELGEVIQPGPVVQIIWPDSSCSNLVDTKSEKWKSFISWLQAE
jgi:hypothetical protein